MLFTVAVAGAVAASGSVMWQTAVQREKEEELLRIGHEFRRAIGMYYELSPGSVKRYPRNLSELLRDDRHLSLQRYMRRLHRDPFGSGEWGTVRASDGGIMGVYSLSEDAPRKRAGFDAGDAAFAAATRYSDWKFVYTPRISAQAR